MILRRPAVVAYAMVIISLTGCFLPLFILAASKLQRSTSKRGCSSDTSHSSTFEGAKDVIKVMEIGEGAREWCKKN